jgi:hypothetical protein
LTFSFFFFFTLAALPPTKASEPSPGDQMHVSLPVPP